MTPLRLHFTSLSTILHVSLAIPWNVLSLVIHLASSLRGWLFSASSGKQLVSPYAHPMNASDS